MTQNRARAAIAGVALACTFAVATPAAAAGFEELYQRGQEARAAGNYDCAERLLSASLKKRPGNTDVLLLLGTTYAFQQEWDRAEAALTQGLERAPEYLDLRLALARTHYWQNDYRQARDVLRPALEAEQPSSTVRALAGRIALADGRPARAERLLAAASDDTKDPDVLIALGDARAELGDRDGAKAAYQRARALSGDDDRVAKRLDALRGRPWRIDVAKSYSHLSDGRDDWRALDLTLSRDLDGAGTLSVSGRGEDRGFASDVRLGVSYAAAPRPFARWRVSGAVTPDADFLAERRISTGGDLRVHNPPGERLGGTWLVGDHTVADYGGSVTHIFEPGLRQAFADGRVSLEGRAIAIHDSDGGWMAGWKARADARVSDDLDLFAGAARAPETQPAGTGFETVDTLSLFAGLRVDLAPSTSLMIAASRHDREDAYKRTQIAISLTVSW